MKATTTMVDGDQLANQAGGAEASAHRLMEKRLLEAYPRLETYVRRQLSADSTGVIGAPLPLSALLTISLVSGMSVAVIAVVFGLATTYGSYRLGIDPDDTTVPIVTNVVDVFGMVIFIGVSTLVLG